MEIDENSTKIQQEEIPAEPHERACHFASGQASAQKRQVW
jgi:hypothetical protein